MHKLIVIEGTNASGKSGLGVRLAERWDGEVVSADSRQVFRGLDLGSGKITPEETRGVPHHLIDVCDPGDFFSMHDFQRLAYAAIDDIISRGKLPILCGGTGLYSRAVTQGYDFSDAPPSDELRKELSEKSRDQLLDILKSYNVTEIDPQKSNRHLIRMIEKLVDGRSHEPQNNPRYDVLQIGMTYDRPILLERIKSVWR